MDFEMVEKVVMSEIPIGEGLIPQIESYASTKYEKFTTEDFIRAIKDLCTDDGNRNFHCPLIRETYDKNGKLTNINWGQWISIDWNIKDGYPTEEINKAIKDAHSCGLKLPTECDWYMKGLEDLLRINDII